MEPPDDLSDSEYAPDTQISKAPPSEPAQSPSNGPKQAKLKFDRPTPAQFLDRLNPAQRDAVTASPEGGLAVHAGPGSGKTAVLTTRVAYLVEVRQMAPEQLVVVTFTNKAANEMKIRLCKMIGAETVDKLVMGTFHSCVIPNDFDNLFQADLSPILRSVCVRYLRKYAKLVGLESNFLISDRDDCLAVIKRLLPTLPIPERLRSQMKPNTWLEYISRCKSRMQTPEQYRAERVKDVDQEKVEAVALVYEAYEEALANSNALDFDDLLVRGLQLFHDHPRVVAKIKSVLIDEFQDTNSVQYDIVKLIAASSNSLTIVGDPDQSIYGWRNAEIENLEKMLKDFQPVRQVFLEQNYRSTGAILGAALAVVRQDTKRINKSLTTSHPSGSSVVLHPAPSAPDEATFIASTIRHLMAHLGGLVNYNDFAILLRYGALSRNIETALQKAGIPSRMVGGHKFFERTEIKDMLSYLQLISNPSYSPALARVLNVPRRGIGDKTQGHIFDVAEQKRIPAFEICVRTAKGQDAISGLTGAQRKAIKTLVQVVRDARKKADEGTDVAALIDLVVDRIGYRTHLERTQANDAAERWENIMELKAYATTVANENPTAADLATAADADEPDSQQFDEVKIEARKKEDDDLFFPDEEDADDQDDLDLPTTSQTVADAETTPLEVFLATSMLATDVDTQDAKGNSKLDKVTISTCHAAKGLEWPVVFVPACEDGTYPFYRSVEENEIDEERRLLYVAITRAQSFCFLSHAAQRMAGADMRKKQLSPFIETAQTKYSSLFVQRLQKVTEKTRQETAKVLGRPLVDEQVVKQRIDEYAATLPVEPPIWDGSSQTGGSRNHGSHGSGASMYASQGRYGGSSNYGSYGGGQGRWSNPQSQPVPAGHGGFRSALSTYKGAGASTAAGGLGGFGRPSSSAPARSGFKPPAAVAPVPNRTASLGTTASVRPSLAATAGIPLAPIPQSRPVVDGPPGVVETRVSVINDAVLLNPKLSAPGPSKSTDLLASFQKGAENDLDVFKRLVAEKPAETPAPAPAANLVPGPANGEGPPMSPRAKGTKRRAPPAAVPASRTSTRKKAKQ
ncbi:hypothetical protein JCM3774_001294 [Rhodotorula dairenensis]